jgi:hypothetical protein
VAIACTLEAGDRADRVSEWATFLSTSVCAVERPSATLLRVQLDRSVPGVVDHAVDLASRENACCSFFEFTLAVGAKALWLEMSAPLEAATMLDDFAELSSRPGDHVAHG